MAVTNAEVLRRWLPLLPPVVAVLIIALALNPALAREASVAGIVALGGVAAWFWRSSLAERSARQRLELELDRRDRFWTSAAHDLKSHVAAVRLRAQPLARRSRRGDQTREGIAQGMADIEVSASRMATIISELQDVARLEAGIPLRLEFDRTDLAMLTEEAVAGARLRARGRRIELSVSEGACTTGMWDARRLERVLTNLLDNALKFSRPNQEVRVVVRTEVDPAEGRSALVEVVDQGVGIPDSDLTRIFERFHRARNVESFIPGTGLGLAGAREIVAQHGGTIAVESHEGLGSKFTVRLPL